MKWLEQFREVYATLSPVQVKVYLGLSYMADNAGNIYTNLDKIVQEVNVEEPQLKLLLNSLHKMNLITVTHNDNMLLIRLVKSTDKGLLIEHVYSPNDAVHIRFAKKMHNILLAMYPMNLTLKKAKFDYWTDQVEKMWRIDGRSQKQSWELFQKVVEDKFWSVNILCPSKFRKQYDALYTKLIQSNKNKQDKERTATHRPKYVD